MNIDTHVNSIVQNIVDQITTQVQTQAMAAIDAKINEVIAAIDVTPVLSQILSQKIDAKLNLLPIDSSTITAELKNRVENIADSISQNVQVESMAAVKDSVSSMINGIDFQALYKTTILSAIQNKEIIFPASSIPSSAINLDGIVLTGENIDGGIIKNFGSTGIDDKATACQVTIMDDVTVVENNLLTRDLTVKGTTTIEGDLNVTGTMPETSPLFQSVVLAATTNVRASLDQTAYQHYSNMVYAQINEHGLDLSRITINGEELVNGNNLGSFVTASNLQRVGVLQELQVQGEALLSQTLYTTNKRVGINTVEPSQALSVWDQEVEIGFGKQSSNTGIIGTPRNQTLIISANGKNNIIATPDGATTVNKINIGSMSFTVGDMPPSNDQPKGSVVFNSNPSLGGPLGWVSLGEARWANFGIID